MPVAMPKTDAARVAALEKYAILDTDPEQSFDDLTLLASFICKTPIALISLVDENRQWFKSRIGLDVSETPREIAFCSLAIQQSDVFVVPDALKDERFRNNPLVVSEPHIRFYAGAPLINEDGYALGTLCVVDRLPRELTFDQKEALRALSRLVLAQLEFRRNLILLKEALNDRTKEEHERQREHVLSACTVGHRWPERPARFALGVTNDCAVVCQTVSVRHAGGRGESLKCAAGLGRIWPTKRGDPWRAIPKR